MKLGIILSHVSQIKAVKECRQELGVEIHYRIAIYPDIADVAQKLQDDAHVDAILTLAHSAPFLNVSIPVIPIEVDNYDIIRSLMAASHIGKRIAYANRPEYAKDIAKEEILDTLSGLDISVEWINFANPLFNPGAISSFYDEVLKKSCEVVVTYSRLLEIYLRGKNIPVLFQELHKSELKRAICRAETILDLTKSETRYVKEIEKLSNYLEVGFLAISSDSRIVLENSYIDDILGCNISYLRNMKVADATRQFPLLKRIISVSDGTILEIKGKKYSIEKEQHQEAYVRYPLQANYTIEVSEIIRIIDNNRVHLLEDRICRRSVQRGFVAKMHFDDIIGNSPEITGLKYLAQRYAQSDGNILIVGESGTGKELFAQSIHNASARSGGPFVAINCAAFPETLLESELYGYEEGAFTGARKGGKIGLMELAHNGTLFLDEIGEMPLTLQAKLLRSIQEKQILRVGGTKIVAINNRIICATNQDLLKKVREGTFREDLYYRINTLNLHIPPLRERGRDLVILARETLRRRAAEEKLSLNFDFSLLAQLQSYRWPGNIRELQSFIERLLALREQDEINAAVFTQTLQALIQEHRSDFDLGSRDAEGHNRICVTPGTLREMENEVIQAVVTAMGGNVTKAAQLMGISRTTVWTHLRNGPANKSFKF